MPADYHLEKREKPLKKKTYPTKSRMQQGTTTSNRTAEKPTSKKTDGGSFPSKTLGSTPQKPKVTKKPK